MTVPKVLINGGVGLNIIFVDTLKKIGLDFTSLLTPIDVPFYGIALGKAALPLGWITLPFYGIVPGKAAMPLRWITLSITFGSPNNFQT